MIKMIPPIRKKIMNYFKKQLGYGYRCVTCDRNARIIEVFCNEFSFDYVGFRCPKCHSTWGIEFKENQIRIVLA